MFDDGYTPEQAVSDLRGLGFDLFIGEDGAVHGRFREKGRKMTLEMRAVVDRMQSMNDQVAALLRAEEAAGRKEYVGVTVDEALALGQRINAGELALDGVVHYHQSTGLCDLTVKGVVNDGQG